MQTTRLISSSGLHDLPHPNRDRLCAGLRESVLLLSQEGEINKNAEDT